MKKKKYAYGGSYDDGDGDGDLTGGRKSRRSKQLDCPTGDCEESTLRIPLPNFLLPNADKRAARIQSRADKQYYSNPNMWLGDRAGFYRNNADFTKYPVTSFDPQPDKEVPRFPSNRLTGVNYDPNSMMAMGGVANELIGEVPSILNSIMSMTNNNSYSRQPIVNSSAMRNMVSPYAMGGTIDDLDDDEMADLKQQADENGISPEEMFDYLNQDEQEEYQGDEDMPQQQDQQDTDDDNYVDQTEDDTQEYAMGGKIHIKKANRGKFTAYKQRTGKTTAEALKSKNPHVRQMANFARNAKKWHHAMGGSTSNVPVNVEGGEVLQKPGRQVMKIQGPKHEDGGVDMNLPQGSKIYSDRLAIDGVDMKDRKLKREARMNKINKLLEDNPNNALIRNTVKRTNQIIQHEDAQDMALQKTANQIYQAPQDAQPQTPQGDQSQSNTGYAYGGKVRRKYGLGDVVDPTILTPRSDSEMYGYNPVYGNPGGDTIVPSTIPGYTGPQYRKPATTNVASNFTTGDYVGMVGTAFNSIAPLINTNQNARNTPPVINRYRGVGQKALDTNQSAQGYVSSMRTNADTDIQTSSNSRYARNANSASSVNTLRALDAATDEGVDKSRNAVNDTYSKEMISILGDREKLLNTKDQYEAYGQTGADDRLTANIDNFYSNRGANLVNFGRGIQTAGRNLNIARKNQVDEKLISQLSRYGLSFDEDGNLISKKP